MSRAIDLASLVLLVGGAALFLGGFFGMQELRDSPETPFVPGTMEAYALTKQFFWLQRMSYFGLGLVAAGIAVGLSAAAHAYKIGRRRAGESSIEEL